MTSIDAPPTLGSADPSTSSDDPVANLTAAQMHSLGLLFKAQGELRKALTCFQKGLKVAPEDPSLWSNAGSAQRELGELPNAILSHRRALRLDPQNQTIRTNLESTLNDAGAAFKSDQKFDQALSCYREALALNASNPVTWTNIGSLFLAMAINCLPKREGGQPDVGHFTNKAETWQFLHKSVHAHRNAVRLEPGDPFFANNLAASLDVIIVILRDQRRHREALAYAKESVSHAPNDARSWSNLGKLLNDLKFTESAIVCHLRATLLAPKSADYFFNLAFSYVDSLRLTEAVEILNKALTLKPDDRPMRCYRAMANLRLGNYAEGWRDYEERTESGMLPGCDLPGNLWRGGAYVGQRLLIVTDQGYGDSLWALRYLARVKALGGELIVQCDKAIAPLISGMGIADMVLPKGGALPPIDWHIRFCSLPGFFVQCPGDISGAAYLTAPADRLAKAVAAVRGVDGKLKVGIVWRGNESFKGNHDRAVPLQRFLDAFALPGVQLYSLQKGPPSAELRAVPNAPVIDLGPTLNDFADTAAVVAQLDLVIMTDTAVAHLAGALGKPVWVLLNYGASWMWLTDRHDSPWYNSLRLFRPAAWNDWTSVFDRATQSLFEILSTRSRPMR